MKITEIKGVSTKTSYSTIAMVLIIVGVTAVAFFSSVENDARATVIFSDGFEGGDTSAWSFVLNVDVTSSSAHSGEYSAFCNTSDVFHVTAEGLYGSAGWGNHVFARGYFRLGSMAGYDWTLRDLLYMTDWSGNDEAMVCDMAIDHWTGNDYVWAMSYLNGAGMSFVAQTSPFVLDTTAWYCIELESYIASSGGYFNLYVNGVIVLSEIGVNNVGRGVINHVGFGQLESGDSYHVDTWWDDCVIADSYIGSAPVFGHDVSIANVLPLKTVVGRGYAANIMVNAADLGEYSETFNVTVSANSTSFASQNVTLSSGGSATLAFSWDVKGFAYGSYALRAYASPVPGETDLTNNNFTDGAVTVTIPGDVNGDFTVDIYDALMLAGAFNAGPGGHSWNSNVDINGDSVVDIYDAIILADHFGQHLP